MINKYIYILIIVFNCFVSAASQVLLKKSAGKEYSSFWMQYLNAQVIIAYIMYAAVLMLNIYIMKFLPLVVVAPINGSLPFILSIYFGKIFFNEKVTMRKIIGSILIVCGIIVISIFS